MLRRFVERRPWLKSLLKPLLRPFRQETSGAYAELDTGTRAASLANAWQSDAIPLKQRAGVDRSIAAYREGAPIPEFDVLVGLFSLDRYGLAVVAISALNASWRDGDAFATKIYLCEKI
jgi:hypothetical protein